MHAWLYECVRVCRKNWAACSNQLVADSRACGAKPVGSSMDSWGLPRPPCLLDKGVSLQSEGLGLEFGQGASRKLLRRARHPRIGLKSSPEVWLRDYLALGWSWGLALGRGNPHPRKGGIRASMGRSGARGSIGPSPPCARYVSGGTMISSGHPSCDRSTTDLASWKGHIR